MAGLRRDVDDPAEALADHDAGRELAGEVEPLEVDRDRVVEVRDRHVLGMLLGAAATGVVDEDVERAEFGHRPVDPRLRLVEVGDVHRQRQRLPPHRLDLGDEVVGRPGGPQTERHVGSGMGERQRYRPAEAACGAGHEGDAPAQVETRKLGHGVIPLGSASQRTFLADRT